MSRKPKGFLGPLPVLNALRVGGIDADAVHVGLPAGLAAALELALLFLRALGLQEPAGRSKVVLVGRHHVQHLALVGLGCHCFRAMVEDGVGLDELFDGSHD